MEKKGRIKYVAGDDYKFSPRVFAQKFFYKLGEELPDDVLLKTRSGRMIFRQGDEDFLEVKCEKEELDGRREERAESVIQQNQSPAELADEIVSRLDVLNLLYEDLEDFGTTFSPQFQEMREELSVVSFAMLRIYQSLSGRNRPPRQNLRKPQVRGFCRGVVITINYLRGILFDLRRLVRTTESFNVQIIIIILTLQGQQSQLQDMRQDCMEGGVQ
ncbi:MAG: hypothetical protein J6K39_04045 [Clostridia bacterium]|nr:hypothetical protein [Clostridia bacterium]